MMAQLLTLEGFSVETASNGREALRYLEGEDGGRPNLILLDLMMPVMDGWEFRRRQLADTRSAEIPVVVLSALDQTRAADIQGAAFLKKPLDFGRLIDLVHKYYQ